LQNLTEAIRDLAHATASDTEYWKNRHEYELEKELEEKLEEQKSDKQDYESLNDVRTEMYKLVAEYGRERGNLTVII
jgi:uncharacterized protein YdeI (YjbR/CyaY-like superfamily)